MKNIQPLHSYRALLWPEHIEAEDVQRHADCGALPIIRLKAPSAEWAAQSAAHLTGKRVFSVERVELACEEVAA